MTLAVLYYQGYPVSVDGMILGETPLLCGAFVPIIVSDYCGTGWSKPCGRPATRIQFDVGDEPYPVCEEHHK